MSLYFCSLYWTLRTSRFGGHVNPFLSIPLESNHFSLNVSTNLSRATKVSKLQSQQTSNHLYGNDPFTRLLQRLNDVRISDRIASYSTHFLSFPKNLSETFIKNESMHSYSVERKPERSGRKQP